jgi:hypothetical protein
MITIADLSSCAQTQPLDVDRAAPTLIVATDEEANAAVGALIDYFGGDRSRDAVRLVVGAEEVGYIERSGLDRFVNVSNKAFGESVYAGLPGLSTGWVVISLRCPAAGCPASPVMTMTYDEDFPPRCVVHTDLALERSP